MDLLELAKRENKGYYEIILPKDVDRIVPKNDFLFELRGDTKAVTIKRQDNQYIFDFFEASSKMIGTTSKKSDKNGSVKLLLNSIEWMKK